jgi:hypothetical protein
MGFEKKKKRRRVNAVEAYSPENWEIEEDLRAVTRADAVKADPERMKKVRALAKTKLDEYKRQKDQAQQGIELATE